MLRALITLISDARRAVAENDKEKALASLRSIEQFVRVLDEHLSARMSPVTKQILEATLNTFFKV
jgi:hypothetical protein